MEDLKAFRQFDDYLHKDFQPRDNFGLNKTEAELLAVLTHAPNMPCAFYARKIGLERGSFVYVADRLEKRGLILTKGHAFDRRERIVELTEEGQRLAARLNDEFEEHVEERISMLSQADREVVLRCAQEMAAVVRKIDVAPSRRFPMGEEDE